MIVLSKVLEYTSICFDPTAQRTKAVDKLDTQLILLST